MEKQLLAAFLTACSIMLSACTLEEVDSALQTAEKVLTAIEKEKQDESEKNKDNELSGKKSDSLLKTNGTTAPFPAELVRPVDGDTAVFAFDANGDGVPEQFSARFLLIDTPETRHPQLGKQPLGDEAKKRTAALLQNSEITLEFDVGQRLDKYQRILVYVYADGKSVQETLLEEGLARVAYVYPPNTRYLSEFEEKQSVAKNKEIGIWSMEGYVTDRGFQPNKEGNN